MTEVQPRTISAQSKLLQVRPPHYIRSIQVAAGATPALYPLIPSCCRCDPSTIFAQYYLLQVRPQHYIRSILPGGPVGSTRAFRCADQLLEVSKNKVLYCSGINEVLFLIDHYPIRHCFDGLLTNKALLLIDH